MKYRVVELSISWWRRSRFIVVEDAHWVPSRLLTRRDAEALCAEANWSYMTDGELVENQQVEQQ